MSEQSTVSTPVAKPDQLTLAFERTYLAYERTLMAWIRTATALITFGFALYKFVFYMREETTPPLTRQEPLLNARTFGLILIGTGVLALVLATWQHWRMMKRLRSNYPDAPWSLSFVLAALISALGVMALLAAV